MARNFGHPHCFRGPSRRCARPTPARQLLGALFAQPFYSAKCFLKGASHSFSKAHRASAQPVATYVIYGGNVVFAHAPTSEGSV
jgi:hypothetical protein